MARPADPADRLTILQGGRLKAYRPQPPAARASALASYLAACSRGEWFEAHELLEPAWLGTAELPERDLYQGLIKIAAAHVHRGRGNALGMRKNLVGARVRLAAALEGHVDPRGFDVAGLIAAIDDRLRRLDRLDGGSPEAVPTIEVVQREPPQPA